MLIGMFLGEMSELYTLTSRNIAAWTAGLLIPCSVTLVVHCNYRDHNCDLG